MEYNRNVLKRKMNRVIKYLDKYNLSNDEKVKELLNITPLLKNYYDDEINSFSEHANYQIKRIRSKQDILDKIINLSCKLGTLREPKEKWTKEVIVLFLLRSFNAYDFKKRKYDKESKLKIASDFSVSEIRLTDQVNYFVNECLNEDKYGLLLDDLIQVSKLIKWKYRFLYNEKDRKEFNIDTVERSRDRKIISKLFYDL